jgi:hypothetical protein
MPQQGIGSVQLTAAVTTCPSSSEEVQEKQYDTDDQKKVNESAGYPERQIPNQPQNNQNCCKC